MRPPNIATAAALEILAKTPHRSLPSLRGRRWPDAQLAPCRSQACAMLLHSVTCYPGPWTICTAGC